MAGLTYENMDEETRWLIPRVVTDRLHLDNLKKAQDGLESCYRSRYQRMSEKILAMDDEDLCSFLESIWEANERDFCAKSRHDMAEIIQDLLRQRYGEEIPLEMKYLYEATSRTSPFEK